MFFISIVRYATFATSSMVCLSTERLVVHRTFETDAGMQECEQYHQPVDTYSCLSTLSKLGFSINGVVRLSC